MALVLLPLACRGGATAPTTVEVAVGPWAIEPGQELTRCVVFRLDNAAGGFVRGEVERHLPTSDLHRLYMVPDARQRVGDGGRGGAGTVEKNQHEVVELQPRDAVRDVL